MAKQSLTIIKRIIYIDKEEFAILYRAYIKLDLEYCVQAWCPYLLKDIKCLEKVQRRATKLVPPPPPPREKSNEEELKDLNPYPLEEWEAHIIEALKILNGLEDRCQWAVHYVWHNNKRA